MSEPKLISPLLDHFDMGDPISCHDGVRCCPAMEKDSDNKYIVKIISIPASQVQLDALLLTGAYKSAEDAKVYFKDLTDQVVSEAETLQTLSAFEGFLPYQKWQTVPMSEGTGYQVYLLGEYRRTLEQHFRRKPMTHLGAVNLGLDLCAAMAVCRHSGYLYVDLKPGNICIVDDHAYRVFDLGFVKLSGLKYASLPDKYISRYTAPEITDAFSSLNATVDIYAIGLILYQAYNNGSLPFTGDRAPAEVFAPPAYADYEMSEIIMKACAPDPKDRWQDPIQMGQALVSYMQRNGANDVPIIPVSNPEDEYPREIEAAPIPEELPDYESAAPSEPDDDSLQETFFETDGSDYPDPTTAEAPVDIAAISELIEEDAQQTSSSIADQNTLPSSDPMSFTESAPEADSESSPESFREEDPDSSDAPSCDEAAPEVIALPGEVDEASLANSEQDLPQQDETIEELIYTEDDLGNLSFMDSDEYDETASDCDADAIDYEELSTDVSEILSYADDLLSHPVPDPVIPPDPIEVAIPEPILPVEAEPAPEEEVPDFKVVEKKFSDDAFPAPTDISNASDGDLIEEPQTQGAHLKKYLIAAICMLLIAGLAFLGFYYYQHYYLQPISITTEGTEDSLVVYVSSEIDESKLTVFCADTYGNSLYRPVLDGKATFTDLAPGSGYTISVEVSGFHRLTGNTSTAYSTPVQTNVVQFTGISGPEDGSVILSFAIDGPDSQKWSVLCSADGVETKRVDFTGHMITIGGLTVGKEYTFTLESESSVFITGNYQLNWVASENIIAENLAITGCDTNQLTAAWNAPVGSEVKSWSVRCYNDSGFDETVTTESTTAVFSGIDHTKSYTVEVTAANMTVSSRAYIGANSATVTGFSANSADPGKLTLTWTTAQPLADGNWILLYSADGLDPHEVPCSSDNTAEISPVIPNATYTFTLLTNTGSYVFNNTYEYQTAEAPKFSNYNVTADHMEFHMCLTPEVENWDRLDLKPADYTTTFTVGQKASFLVRVRHEYNPVNENIVTLFVIRDRSGNIVKTATSEEAWINMWYRGYCELDIPVMPSTAGDYTISIYFNGYYAGEREFTVTNP